MVIFQFAMLNYQMVSIDHPDVFFLCGAFNPRLSVQKAPAPEVARMETSSGGPDPMSFSLVGSRIRDSKEYIR